MTDFKKGGPLQNSNIYATNRLFVKNPLFKKRKKKRAPGVYNPTAKFKYKDGGENKTKLTKEEEKQFQKFYKTLPENLQSDDNTYDIRGYWDGLGRPQEFDYTQPTESDGYYHAFSINPNTGEYLKSPAHDTFQHAVDEDRKIGYRPLTNVYGRNVAVENESIADPEAQTFLRNTQGPVSYKNGGSIIDLTEEEIQKYIDGGYVVEEVNDPSIPALNRFDNGGALEKFTNGGGPGDDLLKKNLQEVTIYDPKTKKEQLNLFEQLRVAKEAYQNYTKQNKGKKWTLNAADPLSSSISDLRKQIKLYKDEFKKEKEETERELKRLESLKNRSAFKNNKDIQNLTLKDLSTVKGKAKLLDAARSSNLSGDELSAIYKGWGLDQADYNVKKGSGSDAVYSAKETKAAAMKDVPQFVNMVSNVATAIPLLGAAGAAGTAGAAILENPYVQAGLTGYGLYDATTNTLPEAYKDFSEGRYLEGAGNVALAGLDLVPGVGLAGKGAKLAGKGVKGIANYGNDVIQTSKQAGKLALPKYKDVYRVEHADFNQAANADDLTGRWFGDNPLETKFYAQKLKDPKTGEIIDPEWEKARVRVLQQRLPEYKIQQQFGAGMPEEARMMSIGKGDLTNAEFDELVGQGASKRLDMGSSYLTDSDVNSVTTAPFLFRKEEGILDADMVNKIRGNTNAGRFSSGKSTIFDDQEKAIEYLFDEAGRLYNPKSKYSQYLPFNESALPFLNKNLKNDAFYKSKNTGTNTSTGLTEADIAAARAEEEAWLTSDEYLKRRMKNTGESAKAVREDVAKILKRADKANYNVNADLKGAYGEMATNIFINPKVSVSKTAPNPKKVLRHENIHLYSPASKNKSILGTDLHKGWDNPNVAELKASERGVYANYPTIGDSPESIMYADPSDYHYNMLGYEQQARHLGAMRDIAAKNNVDIKAGKKLTEQQVRSHIDDFIKNRENVDYDYDEIWGAEILNERKKLADAYGAPLDEIKKIDPDKYKEIINVSKDNAAKTITKVLNNAWVVAPTVGVAGTAAMMANPFQGSDGLQQQKKGGSKNKYIEVDIPEEEIQWYIDNGYRVEPVTKLKKFIG